MTQQQFGSLREKIAADSAARRTRYAEFEALFKRAHEAGDAAAKATVPPVMVVRNNRTGQVWHEADGPCGFAWVIVRPGTSSFAKWAVKNTKFRPDSYYGGVCLWVGDYDQSIARKEAYARAFAQVLTEAGIRASANSRLD